LNPRMSSTATSVALILAGLLSLALACKETTAPAPDVPTTAVPLVTPARFALWWRLTQACSGTTGDFASVSWYVVPNTTTLDFEGEQVNGYWLGNPDRIVLADAYRTNGLLVRHEMLHALLHHSGHPRFAFVTACGGMVACDGSCDVETGGHPAPPASAPELQPREVDPRVDVMTPTPAQALDSGAVSVMVTITNPRTEPVWVRLTPRESGDLDYQTFGIVADFGDPANIATLAVERTAESRVPLGAGENRRWVWDGALNQGRFGIRGFFNVDTVARQVIQIGQ
jgi:hypothetical protein